MNSKVDAREFSDALGRAMKLAAKRSPVSVLEQVKVSFTGTACTLTATDLEQWGVIELPAEGDSFSFVLGNTKEVQKMLDKQNGMLYVAFAPDKNLPKVKLVCDGRASQFFVSDAADYPEMPQVEAVQTYRADSDVLVDLVYAVSYAVSTNADGRPAMGGVRFWGREVYCVDGYRMAVADNDQLDASEPFVIPARMFRSWRALFPAGMVEIAVGKKFLQVSAGGVMALFRLLEPDTMRPKNVFPTSCRERYQVRPKEYASELAYLSGFVTYPLHQPVAFRGGQLSVMTANGEYSAKITVDGSAEIVFGFNVKFMLEAMKAFEDQEYVTVEVSHPNGAIVLRASDGRKTLILPMHLKEERNRAA